MAAFGVSEDAGRKLGGKAEAMPHKSRFRDNEANLPVKLRECVGWIANTPALARLAAIRFSVAMFPTISFDYPHCEA